MANRRTGKCRAARIGKRTGTLPASRDPLIQRRRARAAALWLAGLKPLDILAEVNAWLESEGELAISLRTLHKDHRALQEQWLADARRSILEARISHLKRLYRLLGEHWQDYDRARENGGNTAPIVDNLRKLIISIAELDGTAPPKRLAVSKDDPADTAARRRIASLLAAGVPQPEPVTHFDPDDPDEPEPESDG